MKESEVEELISDQNHRIIKLLNVEIQKLIDIADPDFEKFFAGKLITPSWGYHLTLKEFNEIVIHYDDMLIELVNSDFENQNYELVLDVVANIEIILSLYDDTFLSQFRNW